jgi:membrane protein
VRVALYGRGVARVWWTILASTWQRASRDNLSALAAGAAFYALLSIFPTLTAVVSLYGLIADPGTVAREVTAMQGLLPPEAVALIATWLKAFVEGSPSRFGIGLLVSVLLAFWSAWSATGMLMTAVNICYGEKEDRSFVWFNLHAVALTGGLALFGIAALALFAVLPTVFGLLPLPVAWDDAVANVRWPTLAGIVIIALAIVYHYAPSRVPQKWQWISWGAIVATVLWLLGSAAFTFYVTKVGSYDKTYGSLGAVIILLLWFYLSAYVTLIGAELNAEIERQAMQPLPQAVERSATGRSVQPQIADDEQDHDNDADDGEDVHFSAPTREIGR